MNNSALFDKNPKHTFRRSLWIVVLVAVVILLRILTHPHLQDPHHLVWKSYSPSGIGLADSSAATRSHAAAVAGH
jgi:hypothetical protein